MKSTFDRSVPAADVLSPLMFLDRAAHAHPHRTAVIDGRECWSWREFADRCRSLAAGLLARGVRRDSVVTVQLPNCHELLECHFALPLAGLIISTINTRRPWSSLLDHIERTASSVLILHSEFAPADFDGISPSCLTVIVGTRTELHHISKLAFYEELIRYPGSYEPSLGVDDERSVIAINPTSGTTGQPKLVEYTHRGALLNSVANILDWDIERHPVFLWTLPMFHCNGWCFPWTIAARAGVSICVSDFGSHYLLDLIQMHGVTHYCGAPVIHSRIATEAARRGIRFGGRLKGMVAGAAPSPALFAALDAVGIEVCHVYGLTETYGPAVICEPQSQWKSLAPHEQAVQRSRQGVPSHLLQGLRVLDGRRTASVPPDGATVGEIALKGSLVAAYVGHASDEGEWFLSGDLAVVEPDGYIRIVDRKKDLIISGGENISSIEVEQAIEAIAGVTGAAVVGIPDAVWGEIAVAFIEPPEIADDTARIRDGLRQSLENFKVPKHFHGMVLPRNENGKVLKGDLRKYAIGDHTLP